jgi:hypothetical protein
MRRAIYYLVIAVLIFLVVGSAPSMWNRGATLVPCGFACD